VRSGKINCTCHSACSFKTCHMLSDICYRKENVFKSEKTFFQIFNLKTLLKVVFSKWDLLGELFSLSSWSPQNGPQYVRHHDIQTGSQPYFSRSNVLKTRKDDFCLLVPGNGPICGRHVEDLELENLRRWWSIVPRSVVHLYPRSRTYYQRSCWHTVV